MTLDNYIVTIYPSIPLLLSMDSSLVILLTLNISEHNHKT